MSLILPVTIWNGQMFPLLREEVTKAEMKFNLPVSSTPCFSLPQVSSNALF